MKWLQGVVLTVASVAIVADAQVAPRPTPRTELMMVTGAEFGVYYAMGSDIKRLLDEVAPEVGIELAVLTSQAPSRTSSTCSATSRSSLASRRATC
jgi:TRAP-type uncharacterized transport system substrate-binding protein